MMAIEWVLTLTCDRCTDQPSIALLNVLTQDPDKEIKFRTSLHFFLSTRKAVSVKHLRDGVGRNLDGFNQVKRSMRGSQQATFCPSFLRRYCPHSPIADRDAAAAYQLPTLDPQGNATHSTCQWRKENFWLRLPVKMLPDTTTLNYECLIENSLVWNFWHRQVFLL